MTPAARAQAAIEILEALKETAQPADRFLKHWFTSRRYAGSKDRAAVGERVYDIFRHRAHYGWRMGRDDARALVLASLTADALTTDEIDALFSGGSYAPAPLTAAEKDALASAPDGAMPAHVEGEYPEWLEPELTRAFGADLVPEMRALMERAPVDLRVNRLRAERDDMLAGLIGLGFAAAPTPFAPTGIRIPSGAGLGALQQSSFFQTGAVEFQDKSSQIASLLCAAKPGERVLDYAAGAGGKALALAAEMGNRGEILACDSDAKRLAQLAPRARRAGASIIRTHVLEGDAPPGEFDLVLLDAPCTGSGAWRRNPEAKWRLSPARLDELTRLQATLLDRAAAAVRPGGRLVYATCSILPRENADQAAAFLARNPGFAPVDAGEIWRRTVAAVPPPGLAADFRATPLTTGTDGFFACVLTRNSFAAG